MIITAKIPVIDVKSILGGSQNNGQLMNLSLVGWFASEP